MKRKRIISLAAAVLLAAATLLGVPKASVTAYADSGDAAMSMGAGALAKNANSPEAQVLKYGGQSWYVIGHDGSSATLLAKENLGHTEYDPNTSSNAYGTSTLKTKVDAIASGFTSQEQAAVSSRTLTGGNPDYGVEGHNENDISGDSVNALLWPLSVAEANNVNSELRKADPANTGRPSSFWWLRSPGDSDSGTAYVDGKGGVNSNGGTVGINELGVRPAFYLNLSSVLFTSAAAGGKSSGAGGADALSEIGTNSNNEWKVTLKGLAPGFNVSYCAGSYDSGSGAVTVKYRGAAGNYISAIVTDSSGGTIKKYGKIAAVNETDGEVVINTAGKMDAGDKLYVFCEQDNGDNATDYASGLREIPIPTTGDHVWHVATCTEPKTCSICGTTEGNANGHSFVYALSEDGKSITAACSAENCPSGYHENGITVTLKAPEDLTCDGSAKEATISGYQADIPNLEEEPEIVYYKSAGEGSTEPDGNKLSGAPSAAGNYVTKITWGEKTASAAFTITKTAAQINKAPSASAITYGQTLKNSTLSGGEANVPGTFAWKDSTKAPAVSDSDKTEYDVVFTPEDTDIYAAAECKVTVTVNKADASVTVAPEGKDLSWSGKAQKLVSEGTAYGGTMQYAFGTDDKTAPADGWGTNVPEAADPDTYYVWYKAAGDENHNDSEAACVTSTITAKLLSYKVTFKVKNGAWDDKTTADKTVTLSRYENEDLALALKPEDIPAVGNEPEEHYKAGSWDKTPDTETEIKDNPTYTYTYTELGKLTIRFDANSGQGEMADF